MMNKNILHDTEHRTAPMPTIPWVMYQKWEDILVLHVSVEIEELAPFIPDQLTLDTYQGKAWISIFPFLIRDLRFRGLPKFPYVHHFLELNVRTYVTYNDIPGVYFFSLDAAKALPVLGARTVTLPYFKARMKRTRDNGGIIYSSQRQFGSQAYFKGKYKVTSESREVEEGTIEHWLFERYRLYQTIGGTVWHIAIHHLPWTLAEVSVISDNEAINSLLQGNIEGVPTIAHYSHRLETLFWPLQKSKKKHT